MADLVVANPTPTGELEWVRTTVAGRPASYGVAGTGPVVVFLHGWGLSHRAYRKALQRLIDAHMCVYAPALPGFGSADLPGDDRDLPGYARWVDQFLERRLAGRAGNPGRPLVRRRGGHPDRVRLAGPGGPPGHHQLDRRLGLVTRRRGSLHPGTAAVGLGTAHAGRRAAAAPDQPRPAGDRCRRRAEHAAPSRCDRACCQACSAGGSDRRTGRAQAPPACRS